MYYRLCSSLLCIATLFATGDSVLASPIVQFSVRWQFPDAPPSAIVPWAFSLKPDKPVPGAGDTADVELQIAFEFTRDLLVAPTLDSDHLTSLPAINPYTGEINEGLSIHYAVPSQLGRDGNVNVMFLSFAGSDVSVNDEVLRLSFTTDGSDGVFYEGRLVQEETSHFLKNSLGVGRVWNKFPDGNIDGTINGLDIDEMIRALGNNAAWEARHPGFDILEYLDGNIDGKVDNLDIQSYIGALANPAFLVAANNAQIPEPTTSALAFTAIAALGLLRAAGFTRRRAVKP